MDGLEHPCDLTKWGTQHGSNDKDLITSPCAAQGFHVIHICTP